jgi:hypothetical protein
MAWRVYQVESPGQWSGIEERPNGQEILIRTDAAYEHRIIVKSADRFRYGPPPSNKLLYICPVAMQIGGMESIEIVAIAKEAARRIFIEESALYTFTLNSREYLYFIYSNPTLPFDRQTLSLTSTIESPFLMQSVPRLLYTLCSFDDPSACFLTDSQADDSFSLTLLPGTVEGEDTYLKTRYASIGHNPEVCQQPEITSV